MKLLRNILVAAMLAVPAGSAVAADIPEPDETEVMNPEWKFEIGLYMFMAGIKGDVGVSPRLPTANVDASFLDILDHLRFALAGNAEARNGTYFGFTDFNYLNARADGGTPGPLIRRITVDSKTLWWTLAGGYTIHNSPDGYIDIFAGGRVWNVDTRLSVNFRRFGNRSRGISEWWFDPIVGVKGKYHFAPDWYAIGYGDIGGFGLGSDLTFQLYGGIGWKPTDNISLELGYRYFDTDYSDGGFVWDVALSGPQATLKINF